MAESESLWTAKVDHFADFEQRADAARLGMWVFLASEIILFGGLFTLYAYLRIAHPAAFELGIARDLEWDGNTNTLILLLSSFLVARALAAMRHDARGKAAALLSGALLLGFAFLGLKLYEYSAHIREGIVPGGGTAFFRAHPDPGLPNFFNLYYLMTGLHAIHVVAGMSVLAVFLFRVWRAPRASCEAHGFEMGAMFWHLVDVVWIFLWPLFYLAGGRS